MVDAKVVSNIRMIGFVGDECVVLELDNGEWEVGGGRVEVGED